MENVLIRACTRNDIDGILQLERLWEQEDIAYWEPGFAPPSPTPISSAESALRFVLLVWRHARGPDAGRVLLAQPIPCS